MPAAKLLTEEERPPRQEPTDATAAQLASELSCLLFAVIFPVAAFIEKLEARLSTSRACQVQVLRVTSRHDPAQIYFGFRPPPVLLSRID